MLPELKVTTAMLYGDSCAKCHRPCMHEDDKTGMPYPGAYDAATVGNNEQVPQPICDKCVEEHYPDRVAEVEAARLHYWTH